MDALIMYVNTPLPLFLCCSIHLNSTGMTQCELRLPGASRWAEQVNKHHYSNNTGNNDNNNCSDRQSIPTMQGDGWLSMNTSDLCTICLFASWFSMKYSLWAQDNVTVIVWSISKSLTLSFLFIVIEKM